jgi:uncharacterized protein
MSRPEVRPTLPWWRVPMVWLVIGGPAAVVVASAVTLALALSGADKPLPQASVAAAPAPQVAAQIPAQQARNHAVAARR